MNELELKLGLEDLPPLEKILIEPTIKVLCRIPKDQQTYDMVKKVCENDGRALEFVSRKLMDYDLCMIAVRKYGCALKYIPSRIFFNEEYEKTKELILSAVKEDGMAVEYVPEGLLDDNIISIAINTPPKRRDAWSYPIDRIPKSKITRELVYEQVMASPYSIKCIPKELITNSLAKTAVESEPGSIRYIPLKNITKKLVWDAIGKDPFLIRDVPQKFVSQELCEECYKLNAYTIAYFPEEFITDEMCTSIIRGGKLRLIEKKPDNESDDDAKLDFAVFPDRIRNKLGIIDEILKNHKPYELVEWNNRVVKDNKRKDKYFSGNGKVSPLKKRTLDYVCKNEVNKTIEPLQSFDIDDSYFQISNRDYDEYIETSKLDVEKNFLDAEFRIVNIKKGFVHEIGTGDKSEKNIYYISDIHVEHQLRNEIVNSKRKKDFRDAISTALKKKITEMTDGAIDKDGILLIGGDVADDLGLAEEFYRQLYSIWNGKVISILGNHELWDGYDENDSLLNDDHNRSVEDIVFDYRTIIERPVDVDGFGSGILLENELYVGYKNDRYIRIREADILESEEKDLSDLLSKCTFIVLGGIGYSGLNSSFNATKGIYRNTIMSMEEDLSRTEHFQEAYHKVLRCAYDKKVIVLTHNPMHDWAQEKYNCNWIYINGHTHRNSILIREDGTTVLADNQIGYIPQKWKLNAFTYDNWYDPFEKWDDGIYNIDFKLFREFNRGRGINYQGKGQPGELYCLKKNSKYMFLLKSKTSLCLMCGGSKRKVSVDDVQYYYNNMALYCERIDTLISPYKTILETVSQDVKRFGGSGKIHGCIVVFF